MTSPQDPLHGSGIRVFSETSRRRHWPAVTLSVPMKVAIQAGANGLEAK